jgi:hypothetical protein
MLFYSLKVNCIFLFINSYFKSTVKLYECAGKP